MDRHQLPLSFDAALMQAEVKALSERKVDWIEHFVTSNYEGEWSVIPLRANRGAEHPIKMIYSDPNSNDYVDTPFLNECPYLKEVLDQFKTTLYSARLMRLNRGSRIKEHRDHDLEVEAGTVRIHVPIVTNPEVRFLLNGTRVVMDEGTCWYLRLSDPHAVTNNGPDRIHLIIDMEANDWLREQLY